MPVAAAIVGGAVIGGGASLLASKSQSKAARYAADVQSQATDQSVAEQRRQFDTAVELTAPRREAENAALNQLRAALGLGGDIDYSQFYETPGYEFSRNEAMRGIERSAAARGGLASGNTLTALQDRAAGLASQNYLSSYLNPLQNLALGGQAAQTGQQGINFGVNVGNTLQQGAANRGSALIGAGNAAAQGYAGVNNAIQGGLSNYLLYSMLRQ